MVFLDPQSLVTGFDGLAAEFFRSPELSVGEALAHLLPPMSAESLTLATEQVLHGRSAVAPEISLKDRQTVRIRAVPLARGAAVQLQGVTHSRRVQERG